MCRKFELVGCSLAQGFSLAPESVLERLLMALPNTEKGRRPLGFNPQSFSP